MQNKAAIQVFTVVFVLVCIYQLSFTWVTRSVREDARAFSGGDYTREQAYLDSMATEKVFNLGIKNYTFKECQEKELNLGLDLKGGMNMVMEVSTVDLLLTMANNSQDSTFRKAIARAKEMQKSSEKDFITLFGEAFLAIDPNARLAGIFNTLENKGKIEYNTSNEEVIGYIKEEARSAVDRTFNILRTRIDKFGVTQPNIQNLGNSRILVELPGVKDPARVRKIMQQTAQLEFWETYESSEIYPFLEKANKRLKDMRVGEDKAGLDSLNAGSEVDTSAAAAIQTDTSLVKKDTSEAGAFDDLFKAAADSDTSAGKAGEDQNFEDWARNNPLFGVLRPFADQTDGRLYPGPYAGIALIKDTAKVNDYLRMPEVQGQLPRDVKLAWTVKPFDDNGQYLQLIALRITNRDGKAALPGDMVVDARPDFGQSRASAEVTMVMNAEGANIWKRLTKEASAKTPQRSIAVVLDGYVYSHPVVQSEIPNGVSRITGDFTIQEAEDLSNVLKAGKLPAPARIVEQAIVGPSLGRKAIEAGITSFAIAMGLVLIYMALYYANAGLVANVALLANVFFIMGVLASLGAVLTLPGIAGIVLTIGMAVDANVLIYERIREELALGKGLRLALTDGYKNAYSSIIDANVTTLLTGVVLAVFGSGPVQGFATTLIIGILTSLFSAIFITRLIFLWMMDSERKISFATALTKGAFKNLNIPFVSRRKAYYLLSGIVIAAGVWSLASRGLNMGIDFKGGRSYVVKFAETVSTADVAAALKVPLGGDIPEVKTFGGADQVSIRTKFMVDDDGPEVDELVEAKLGEGLSAVKGGWEIMSSQKVGPTIADDIMQAAIFSVAFALVVIFIYILIRFRKWQFGLGALAALFHDVLIVLACFSLFSSVMPFSMEINQAFIAALLTVIGYSINDTVVVFDRIREYLKEYRKRDVNEVINQALNSTLSRTLNTSGTTCVVLLCIFILGGEVIRGFSFALLVGVIVGTYSSLCIATPVVVDLIGQKNPENKTS